MKKKPSEKKDSDERDIFHEIMNNSNIIDEIKKNIYIDNNILGDLEMINKIDKDSSEYQKLKKRIINVGEYPNVGDIVKFD